MIDNNIKDKKKFELTVESFQNGCLIVGAAGTGKSFLIEKIIKEFRKKVDKIGMIYLSLSQSSMKPMEYFNAIIKYGDKELKIPYIINGEYIQKKISEFVKYLIVSLELKNILINPTILILNNYYEEKGTFPESINEILILLIDFIKNNPFEGNFQQNLISQISIREELLRRDLNLKKVMEPNENVPGWIVDFIEGKKIYLDLSSCSENIKFLLTNALFQVLRTIKLEINIKGNKNKGMIIIDESHQVFGKNRGIIDDREITNEKDKIFEETIKDLQYKNISLIIASQTPDVLFKSIVSIPSLKIIFRLNQEQAEYFTKDPNEPEKISYLQNGQAFVIDDINGKKYFINSENVKFLGNY